jgi:hypothetical protein
MKSKILGLMAVALLLASVQASADLLANAGFEDPITFDGPPFVGSWEGFSGGGGASAANSPLSPRTGLQALGLSISNTPNTFAGAFQDVLGVTSGTSYTFSGWQLAGSSPFDVGIEVRIEWRDSATDSEIGRTPNLTPIPLGNYSAFSLSAVAPAGADTARVVYAIQSFSVGGTNSGTVFVDDLFFDLTAPPDPNALLQQLLTDVVGVGPGKSLANKIALAQTYYAVPDIQATCAMLTGFINEARAQRGKKLTPEVADKLTADAQAIMEAVGCN